MHIWIYVLHFCVSPLQDLNKLTVSVSEALAEIASQQCSCDFTSDAFEDSDLTCSSNGRQLTFSSAVVFSTQAGDKSASTVIGSLQLWLDNNPNPVLDTSQGSFVIAQDCSLVINSPDDRPSCQSKPQTVAVVAVGTFFGGLLTGAVVALLVVLLIVG